MVVKLKKHYAGQSDRAVDAVIRIADAVTGYDSHHVYARLPESYLDGGQIDEKQIEILTRQEYDAAIDQGELSIEL